MNDALVMEGEVEADELEYAKSIQRAINACMWSLPGRNGRAMMEAIEAGQCMCAERPCRDFYGNVIPSRSMVKEGTKGSRQYVVDNCGEEWAVAMEAA
jgi:hypothetical protein